MKAAGYENSPMKKNFSSALKKDDGIISKAKKKIKKFANESTLLNPKTADEVKKTCLILKRIHQLL